MKFAIGIRAISRIWRAAGRSLPCREFTQFRLFIDFIVPVSAISSRRSGTDRYLSELVPLGLTSFYAHTEIGDPRYVEHMKSRGWWDLVYAMIHDEPAMDKLMQVRNTYKNLIGIPGIRILQTEWSPTKPLEGLVNIWCPLLDGLDTQAARKAQQRGEEVWWYTSARPHYPYPNVCLVDYPTIWHGPVRQHKIDSRSKDPGGDLKPGKMT